MVCDLCVNSPYLGGFWGLSVPSNPCDKPFPRCFNSIFGVMEADVEGKAD